MSRLAQAVPWLYGGGMLLVVTGQRLLADKPAVSGAVSWAGVALVVAACVLVVLRGAKADAPARSSRWLSLTFGGLGLASLGLYAISAQDDWFEPEGNARVLLRCLWPLVWLCASLPFVLVERVLARCPVIVPPERVRGAWINGLIAALGIGLVFPLNYVAHERNATKDVSYFKTTEPGSSTLALVDNLDEMVVVRIFLPPASDVERELLGYFEPLEGDTLRVEVLDHDAEPRLSRMLGIPDNGWISFVAGDVDVEAIDLSDEEAAMPVNAALEVGVELTKARRKLRRLDEEVQSRIRELDKGERVAYVLGGHGELSHRALDLGPDRKLALFKKVLDFLGFTTRVLGPADGLEEGIPEDADLVLVMGAISPLRPEEVSALVSYLDRGQGLLLALEPPLPGLPYADEGSASLEPLLEALGVTFDPAIVASGAAQKKQQRLDLVTDRYTDHPTVATLTQFRPALPLLGFAGGSLEAREGSDTDATIVVRSLASSWRDTEQNLEFDEGETRASVPLVMAVEGAGRGEQRGFRALVASDATLFSDLAMAQTGNRQFSFDSVHWLIGAEAVAGTVNNEEDQVVEHQREDQRLWFYAMVVIIPGLVVVVGLVRTRVGRQADDSKPAPADGGET